MATQRPPETDFERMLDYFMTEIQAGRLTADGCLATVPQLAGELRLSLALAGSLAAARQAAMRPAARDALEERLRARMAERPARRRIRRPARAALTRWLQISAATLLAIVVLGVGVATASASSLPGDLLYPVKRWGESVLLQLATGPGRVGALLDSAQRRLEEFEALSDRGVVDVMLLEEFAAHAQDATAASEALRDDQRAEALHRVVALVTLGQQTALDTADEAGADLSGAADALSGLRASAWRKLLSSPAPESTRTQTPHPTRRSTRTPTSTPTSSRTPQRTATPGPPDWVTPGDRPPLTPPGRGTPGAGLTWTPPGRGTPLVPQIVTPTPRPPRPSPPGQGTPGSGQTSTPSGRGDSDDTPPGQEPKPTKSKTP